MFFYGILEVHCVQILSCFRPRACT
jgi:hypothetical protein